MWYKRLLLFVSSVVLGMINDAEMVSLNQQFHLQVNTAKLSHNKSELLKTILASIKQLHQQLKERMAE